MNSAIHLSSGLLAVLYVSSATALFTDNQLISFLRSWRDYNRLHEIMGFLLYEAGNFMQVIEGPRSSILTLVGLITADLRHRRMLSLWQHAIAAREFGAWQMGFRKQAELSTEDQQAFSSLLQDTILDYEFRIIRDIALPALMHHDRISKGQCRAPFRNLTSGSSTGPLLVCALWSGDSFADVAFGTLLDH